MAKAAQHVACQICGFAKNPAVSFRCVSCGARLDDPIGQGDAATARAGSVNLLWLAVASLVQALLTGAVIFGLPMAVAALDFEGGSGAALCIPVWFVGGLLVGLISPGRTIVEPALATFLVAIPSAYLLFESQTVRILPTFLYVVLAGVGILFSLVGAYFGERIQLGSHAGAEPAAKA